MNSVPRFSIQKSPVVKNDASLVLLNYITNVSFNVYISHCSSQCPIVTFCDNNILMFHVMLDI